ncbi:MAG TPA: Flp pilus assembly protein CpaB [Caulobacteraceae bacterium]
MSPLRIVILSVAAVAAIGLALLVRNMTMAKTPTQAVIVAAAQKPMIRVLVAARDLPVGTRLKDGDLAWQGWPADSLNASYITDGGRPAPSLTGADAAATAAKDLVTNGGPAMEALKGAVVRDALVKGEPMVRGKVVIAGQGGFMSVMVKPGMRAMAIPVNAETGAGGFVQPGDRVDLLSAHQDASTKSGGGFVSQIVVSNVRVLAVDQTTDPAKNGRFIVGSTVTLEIPADATQPVAEARARGGMALALRSYADMGGDPGGAVQGGPAGEVQMIKGGTPSEVAVLR